MRSLPRARWLCLAIALSCLVPEAVADDKPNKKRKSVATCATFDQLDRVDEDGVDFTVASSCSAKLSCAIKWALTCEPDTKAAKKTWGGVAFELENGQTEEHTASASSCDGGSWEITSITWSCDPE